MNSESTDNKKYDIVVFGATAFTGKYVVREMLFNSKYNSSVKWAIAGRNLDKLTFVLEEQKIYLEDNEGISFSDVEVGLITANVNDYQSLLEMAGSTKMIINIVGPYKIYGKYVVKACVENGTHHLDLSGEPGFLEEIQLNYSDKALAKNCYIIGSLGFDSVIADLGLDYCKRNFDGKLLAAESYVYFGGNEQANRPYFHTGTWNSIINSIKSNNQKELKATRRKLFSGKMKYDATPLKKKNIHKSTRDRYALPFMGSDKSVVQRTLRYNYKNSGENTIQYMPYIEYSHLIVVICLIFMFTMMYILMLIPGGEYLLKTYPRFFSFGVFSEEGPSEKSIANTYIKMHFKLYGSSDGSNNVDKIKHTVVSGPNAGYTGTASLVVAAAFTILEENVKDIKGGVLTPAVALSNSSYIDRVEKRGFKFSLVE
ncbi:Saccharopine dehydrogenase-like oxidoreductase [Intoshia linei]|uniref:Saccharopine dehydrogenase-like oxidoreductase n=1 Tax=Intoshia linei TaxID=1819745 RepID=A0A177AYT8_9BILA|nr:Saccharopine dehydrogenase-like oxidoreductase [Intoshia linei]